MDPSVEQLGLFALLLFLSGAFSGSETALTSLGRVRIQKLIEELGARAQPLQRWIDEPERYLTTLLIGNNLVNVGTSVMAALVIERMVGHGSRGTAAMIATFTVTLAILIFGEITPKHFCQRHATTIALIVIRPLHWLALVLWPFEKVLSWISRGLVFLLSFGRPQPAPAFGEAELRAAVKLSHEAGALEKLEQSIITRALRLGDTKVREIMVPRVKMTTLAANAPREELSDLVMRSGHRRIPVYETNRDRIVGVLHVHDLLRQLVGGETVDVKALARKPVFVPETKPVDEMLAFFRKERTHLAIVVNEYGGVEGLLTLEDVLEELVGEIEDEHDRPVTQLRTLDDGRMRASGSIELKELERLFEHVPFHGQAVSLGGWLIEQMGRIPRAGEELVHHELRFVVTEATDKVVGVVEIEQLAEAGDGAEPPTE